MWPHFVNLVHRSWQLFLAEQGTTGLGFVSPYSLPVITGLVAGLLVLARRGKGAMIQHWRQSLSIVFGAALISNILWYGPILGWDVVRTIYTDHQALVNANTRLAKKNEDLRLQLKDAQNAPPRKITKITAAADRFGPIDRYLNAEQKDHLYQELKQMAARQTDRNYITVTVVAAYRHDRESNRLTFQLQRVFQDAGWNVVYQKVRDYENPTYAGQLPIGIWVASSTKMEVAVESGLIDVGLNAQAVPADKVTDQPLIGTLVLIGYKDVPF